jgi:carbamoyltransferase
VARRFGTTGPSHPRLAEWGARASLPAFTKAFERRGFHRAASPFGARKLEELRTRLDRGEEVTLLGLGVGGHNSGAALVSASKARGLELICNEEEERYTAVKHCADYPSLAIASARRWLADIGVEPGDLGACLASWDYPAVCALALRTVLEEVPGTLLPQPQPAVFNANHVRSARHAPERLAGQLGAREPMPIVGVRHHDAHAAFSYAVSPFAHDPEPVMVVVTDGFGDDGPVSLYVGEHGRVRLVAKRTVGLNDSLGVTYGVISATQGGWPILSSEGRYMGAAAWGDGDRLTNPYYRRLRQLLYFGPNGEVSINRALAHWQKRSLVDPYSAELEDILGPPIPEDRMWNPDAVLSVEDLEHTEITRERVDKAAALQMVFEDALCHIVDHMIRTTGSRRLVLTGGTALNCVANMRLLDHFGEDYYERVLGRRGTTLHLWVPPVPGDAGTPPGAAFAFGMQAGAPPGPPLEHAFYCGRPPAIEDIQAELRRAGDCSTLELGNVDDPEAAERVADLLAHIVARDGVLGLYRGSAETGPRALGHRTILANPTNPRTLEVLNARVKARERIRPLAPMATYEAAASLLQLAPGASDGHYNAYNYMVMTAPVAPGARDRIPAVVHQDGTARVQIVRPETDAFVYRYLKAMGRHVGVEVSVNTSLNVGAPIAQTPAHVVDTLRRSKGLDAVLAVGARGEALLIWLTARGAADGRLAGWLEEWQESSGVRLAAAR